MDARVKRAVLRKIDEAKENTAEIARIGQSLTNLPFQNMNDFSFGIAIGRIYNSFHYQTRRILKRDATQTEFAEFLEILAQHGGDMRNALSAIQ